MPEEGVPSALLLRFTFDINILLRIIILTAIIPVLNSKLHAQCNAEVPQTNAMHCANFQNWSEWRLHNDDGSSLFVREFGNGDTVLILHGGWGAEHSYLIDPFAAFASDYHFIFYDQRGSLRSPSQDSLISVYQHVEDIEHLRKTVGAKKLLIIGHSMGGYLAMKYLDQYQDRVKGLILISAPPAKGTINNLTEDINGSALQRWTRSEVMDTLRAHGLDKELKESYSAQQRGLWHRITFAAINLHCITGWKKVHGAFYFSEKAAAMAASTMSVKWDFSKKLKKSGISITIIHGDDDYLPLDYHKKWITSVPNAHLYIIKNAGHLCWIDQPKLFKQYIYTSLEKF